MKLKFIKLALLIWLLSSVNYSLTAEPENHISFMQRMPTFTVERGFYAGTTIAAVYCGYRILSNETLTTNIAALYNLFTTGSVVSEKDKLLKQARRAQKANSQAQVFQTLNHHTGQLTTILSGIDALKLASESFATKQDLANLVSKQDFAAFEQRMNARLDTITEQTRARALTEGVFAALRSKAVPSN